tara:strand:+ start:758 stop:937 length:180 start_codon:yes stop_codon:yes gene_type:complete
MDPSYRRFLDQVREEEWQSQFISPIPPHVSPEERKEWEKEIEWSNKEIKRRKKEGFYKY